MKCKEKKSGRKKRTSKNCGTIRKGVPCKRKKLKKEERKKKKVRKKEKEERLGDSVG